MRCVRVINHFQMVSQGPKGKGQTFYLENCFYFFSQEILKNFNGNGDWCLIDSKLYQEQLTEI